MGRIAYRDASTGRRYVFLTNHFRLAAKTIADIYKERWQIEIFFRFIKQNIEITNSQLSKKVTVAAILPNPKNSKISK